MTSRDTAVRKEELLSAAQEDKIVRLYRDHDVAVDALCERFGRNKTAILRVLNSRGVRIDLRRSYAAGAST